MITLYLDESGTHGSEYVVLAAFAGKKRAWSNFETAWREGLGSRPFLHVSKMPLTSSTEKEWLKKLGPIPYDCGLIPVYGSVSPNDYMDLAEGTVGEMHSHGVGLCLVPIVDSLVKDIPGDERFEFIFEASGLDYYLDRMLLMISQYPGFRRSDGLPRIARWSFVPKDESSLFQAADYLANHLYNREIKPSSNRAIWTQPIIQDRRLLGDRMPRERVRRLFKHLDSDGYQKNIPKEVLKEYKARVRSGAEDDPWKELFGKNQK